MLNFTEACGSIAICDMSARQLSTRYKLKNHIITKYVTYFLVAFKTTWCIGSDEPERKK